MGRSKIEVISRTNRTNKFLFYSTTRSCYSKTVFIIATVRIATVGGNEKFTSSLRP